MDGVGERAEPRGGGPGAHRGLQQVAHPQRTDDGDGGHRNGPAAAGAQKMLGERQENNCPAGSYPSL
ncbi:hypothetical protein [Winogradskya humida]|uniref:Uncharacterized protein n=1 Tax=Winogradskya humida TaxID=113566 RepID=A0ABQ3ZYA1_9ACTN|nr:hypothetical protein [Actinoplanes humidus]GIE23561.1 hypothetical protein Ahu01nite_066630 [Actinoplanes humidus]